MTRTPDSQRSRDEVVLAARNIAKSYGNIHALKSTTK